MSETDKTFLGRRMADFLSAPPLSPFSRVTLLVDDDTCYTAGDDTGQILEANCPWATQDICNAVLAKIKGYQYVPYTSEDALLDPASEIGDGVDVNGIYSVIASIDTTFDAMYTSTASAPADREIIHESQYQPKQYREFNRKIAQTRAAITVASNEILAKVENELNGLSSSISIKLQSITGTVQGLDGRISTVEQTASGLTTTVQGLDGRISTVEQTASGLTTTVHGLDGRISTVEQTASGLTTTVNGINGEINTIKQTIHGVVYESSLADGTTVINGGCIRTGYLTSQRIHLIQDMLWYPSDVPDGSTEESWFAEENAVGQLGFSNLTVDGSTTDCLIYSALKNPLVVGSNLTTYVLGKKVDIHGTLYLNGVYSPIQSDRRLKSDIDYSRSQQMAKLFDNLMPVTYRYNVEPDRIRMGFLAQDVLFAGNQAQLSNVAVDIDNRGYYVLHTDELLAAVVAKVQQIAKRLE